jgi:hypothetical protein
MAGACDQHVLTSCARQERRGVANTSKRARSEEGAGHGVEATFDVNTCCGAIGGARANSHTRGWGSWQHAGEARAYSHTQGWGSWQHTLAWWTARRGGLVMVKSSMCKGVRGLSLLPVIGAVQVDPVIVWNGILHPNGHASCRRIRVQAVPRIQPDPGLNMLHEWSSSDSRSKSHVVAASST